GAGVPHVTALQSEFVDHAAGGGSWGVLEDAAGAFLAERLARSPLFVADTNSLEYFLERLGGEFQRHRQHHIIRRKRGVPVFKGNLVAPEDFYRACGGAIEFHLPNVAADLHSVGTGVHAQGTTDRAGD